MNPEPMNPDDVIPAFDRDGPAWAAARDRRLVERPWLDRALALAPRTGGRRQVLDLGCGAGRPIAEYLLDRGCAVTGVDASRTMIELFARANPGATALNADMRTLTLPQRFDLVVAWDSLDHLPAEDQRGMAAVLAAHAEAGGVLLLATGSQAGPAFRESLDADGTRALLKRAGFEELGHWPQEETLSGQDVWLARVRD